jgi:hypothetical protein
MTRQIIGGWTALLAASLFISWALLEISLLPVSAQQAPYCGSFHPGEGAKVDPSLDLVIDKAEVVTREEQDAAFQRKPIDEFRISWSQDLVARGAECVWVGRLGEGTPGLAELIIPASDRSVVILPQRFSDTLPERICYRLIPMSADAMGNETEVCGEFTNFRQPIPPTSGNATPGAPSVGTGLISDEGSGAWVVGFLVVTGTIVLVLLVNGRLRRRVE